MCVHLLMFFMNIAVTIILDEHVSFMENEENFIQIFILNGQMNSYL